MSPERWKRVSHLFKSALERTPGERAAYLDAACADDPALRRDVESLVTSFEQAEANNFINSPAAVDGVPLFNEDAPMLVVGQVVSRYVVVKPLGAGGMGEVYLARDVRLGREVALKILPAELASSPHWMQRFEQEAKTASALNHPNILTVFEVDEADGIHFIATEYVDGITLREHLSAGQLELQEALDITLQIVTALDAAHEAGVVHRDIKPENVMIRRRDHVIKVLDFGLAKLNTKDTPALHSKQAAETKKLALTSRGMLLGTVSYMSPEQTRAGAVDARTDIWSVGVVLYEMLAGTLPFDGEDIHRQVIAIQERDPLPIPALSGEWAARLAEITVKALAKNPDSRYQTAQELLTDLSGLKQEIAFAAEISRTSTSERLRTANGTTNDDSRAAVPFPRTTAADTTSVARPRPNLNARYFVGGLKRHRGFVAVAFSVIILLAVAGIIYYSYLPGRVDSIAVLPFVNTSRDPNVEYLSDGISESLINSLAQIQRLKVVARSTSFRYKDKEIDPQQVGRELHVRTVLIGRISQVGNVLNIQVELMDAVTGKQLWREEYEREISDVLAVKQAITREIVDNLRLRLSAEELKQLVQHDTSNTEAYQSYLKGRYYWNKRTEGNIQNAIDQFQQAIRKDANYTLAYVGLADCYSLQKRYTGIAGHETYSIARVYAERAIQIDERLAEAHASMGKINDDLWRWEEAEQEFRLAIKLNPNYPTAHHWYSIHLLLTGRLDEALRESKRALELDPLSLAINCNTAGLYQSKGDLNSAIALSEESVKLDPNFPYGHLFLGLAYLRQGRSPEALSEFQKAVELSGRDSTTLNYLGYCYAVSGNRSEALPILKELEGKYARHEAVGLDLAAVLIGLQQKEQALDWLEKDFQARCGWLSLLKADLRFDSLRNDPRYFSLMQGMGLNP